MRPHNDTNDLKSPESLYETKLWTGANDSH